MAISTPPQQPNRNNAEAIDLGRLLGLMLDNKWLIRHYRFFCYRRRYLCPLCYPRLSGRCISSG